MLLIAIILSVAVGLATAAQSPTNAALGQIVGPVQASFVSFTGGLVVCGLLCALAGTGDISQAFQVEPWKLLGGVYGAFIVFSQALCAPRLGVALTLTLFMLGQLMGGMVVDTLGLFEVARVPLSPLRVAGAGLALAGIAFVYVSRIRYSGAAKGTSDQGERQAHRTLIAAVLCFAGGVVSAVQTPTNAALGLLTGTMEASVVSFAGGWLSLLAVLLILHVTGAHPLASFKGIAPWKFTGGLYGAFGVPALIVATPVLGVGLSLAGLMFGQLVGGMVVDATGMFGVLRMRTDRLRIIGAILLLLGIALVTAAKIGL
ncbi:MAG: DMT family transporter [Coriobacteriia bacterium]|nr:DMT family transporter [Coriobacteriia bacterium]